MAIPRNFRNAWCVAAPGDDSEQFTQKEQNGVGRGGRFSSESIGRSSQRIQAAVAWSLGCRRSGKCCAVPQSLCKFASIEITGIRLSQVPGSA